MDGSDTCAGPRGTGSRKLQLAGLFWHAAKRLRTPRDRKSTRLELQSLTNLVCRLLLEKKKKNKGHNRHHTSHHYNYQLSERRLYALHHERRRSSSHTFHSSPDSTEKVTFTCAHMMIR